MAKTTHSKDKNSLIICIDPSQYEVFDQRMVKPVCVKRIENGKETGSMVSQPLDTVDFPKNPLTYFPPNNVGVLLSVSRKHQVLAEKQYKEQIDPTKVNHSFVDAKVDKKKFLMEKSILVADYIENVQISIVFAYTALEAFVNLSIPEEYEYKVKNTSKGTHEIYDKKAIERWISLKDKIANILTVVYETKKIESTKCWNKLVLLERHRNAIIHQKSIERTEFYKAYFEKEIFDVCKSAEEVIQFFFNAHYDKKKTNSLWPWLINKDKEFPFVINPDSNDFEVIGNLYEGIKK